eukprot:PhM_4_TR12041/c0_g1_i1/m.53041/K16196/EIF2AK4; eukaryotic translation initiation factor 2-alpha kinase 4
MCTHAHTPADVLLEHLRQDVACAVALESSALDEDLFETAFSEEIARFASHSVFGMLWARGGFGGGQTPGGGLAPSARDAFGDTSGRFASEFTVVKRLGAGNFGEVCCARNNLDNNTYAIKRILLPQRQTKQREREVLREVTLLANLSHRHLVRYYHAWVEEVHITELSDLLMIEDEEESEEDEEEEGVEECSNDGCGNGIVLPAAHSERDNDGDDDEDSSSAYGEETWMRPAQSSRRKSSSSSSSSSDAYGEEAWMRPAAAPVASNSVAPSTTATPDTRHCSHRNTPMMTPQWAPAAARRVASGHVTMSSPSSVPAQCNDNEKDDNGSPKRKKRFERVVTPNTRRVLFIQMEYCKESTLRTIIEEGRLRDEKHIWSVFRQILSCVEYLHKRDIIHRDLKPDNVFFGHAEGMVKTTIDDASNDGNDVDDIKIGDFGLARQLGTANSAHEIELLGLSHKGTEVYMAPEQKSRTYNELVDEYAAGIILLEMFAAHENMDWRERRELLNRLAFAQPRISSFTDLGALKPEDQSNGRSWNVVDVIAEAAPFVARNARLREVLRRLLCSADQRHSAQALLRGDVLPPEVEDEHFVFERIRRHRDHFRRPLLQYLFEDPSGVAYNVRGAEGYDQTHILERLFTLTCRSQCIDAKHVPSSFEFDLLWKEVSAEILRRAATVSGTTIGGATKSNRRHKQTLFNGIGTPAIKLYTEGSTSRMFIPTLPCVSWCRVLASRAVISTHTKRFSVQPWYNVKTKKEEMCFSMDTYRTSRDPHLVMVAEACYTVFRVLNVLPMGSDSSAAVPSRFYIRINHSGVLEMAGKCGIMLDHLKSTDAERVFRDLKEMFGSCASAQQDAVAKGIDAMRTFLKTFSLFTPLRHHKVTVYIDASYRGSEDSLSPGLSSTSCDGLLVEFGIVSRNKIMVPIGCGYPTEWLFRDFVTHMHHHNYDLAQQLTPHMHVSTQMFSVHVWLETLEECVKMNDTWRREPKVDIFAQPPHAGGVSHSASNECVRARIYAALSCWRRNVCASLRLDGEKDVVSAKQMRMSDRHVLYLAAGSSRGEGTLMMYKQDRHSKDFPVRIQSPYGTATVDVYTKQTEMNTEWWYFEKYWKDMMVPASVGGPALPPIAAAAGVGVGSTANEEERDRADDADGMQSPQPGGGGDNDRREKDTATWSSRTRKAMARLHAKGGKQNKQFSDK